MKSLLLMLTLIILTFPILQMQAQTYEEEIAAYHEELIHEYSDPEESPLNEDEQADFPGLQFFPVDSTYRVIAKIERFEDPETIKMKTSGHDKQVYDRYAVATFQIDSVPCKLYLYQSHRLREKPGYEDYLFSPSQTLQRGRNPMVEDDMFLSGYRREIPLSSISTRHTIPIVHIVIDMPARYHRKRTSLMLKSVQASTYPMIKLSCESGGCDRETMQKFIPCSSC